MDSDNVEKANVFTELWKWCPGSSLPSGDRDGVKGNNIDLPFLETQLAAFGEPSVAKAIVPGMVERELIDGACCSSICYISASKSNWRNIKR